MSLKQVFHTHLSIWVDNVALFVTRDDKLLKVWKSDRLDAFSLMYCTNWVSQYWGVPGQNIAIRSACDQTLSFLHPFDSEERMFLLVQRFSHELRRGSFPIGSWRLIHIWEVVSTVAIVWHYTGSVFHVKVSLSVVPIIILTCLRIQLVLLLVAEGDINMLVCMCPLHILLHLGRSKHVILLIALFK